MVRQDQSSHKTFKSHTNNLKLLHRPDISSAPRQISEWSRWFGIKTKDIISSIERMIFETPADDELCSMKNQINDLQRQMQTMSQQSKFTSTESAHSSSICDRIIETSIASAVPQHLRSVAPLLDVSTAELSSHPISNTVQPNLVEKGLKLLELCESMELDELIACKTRMKNSPPIPGKEYRQNEISYRSNGNPSLSLSVTETSLHSLEKITSERSGHISFHDHLNSNNRSAPKKSEDSTRHGIFTSSNSQHNNSNPTTLNNSQTLYSSERNLRAPAAAHSNPRQRNTNSENHRSLIMSRSQVSHSTGYVKSAKSNGVQFRDTARHSILNNEARLLKDVSNLIHSNSGPFHKPHFSSVAQFQPKKLFSSVDVKSIKEQRGRTTQLTFT